MVTTPGATLIVCETVNGDRKPLRFLIMDAPSPSSLSAYIKEMQKHNVGHLVRVCGPTYKSDIVERTGIQVHHWQFDDGAPPPRHIVEQWLSLLDHLWKMGKEEAMDDPFRKTGEDLISETRSTLNNTIDTRRDTPFTGPCTVAVHCVAGLGRAPILVALALVEYGSFDPLDAIGFIRERRRGAINNVQLNWLMKYRRRSTSNRVTACCVIS